VAEVPRVEEVPMVAEVGQPFGLGLLVVVLRWAAGTISITMEPFRAEPVALLEPVVQVVQVVAEEEAGVLVAFDQINMAPTTSEAVEEAVGREVACHWVDLPVYLRLA
jgi:hypothetical protein